MSNLALRPLSCILVLSLGMGGGSVLAKGPDAQPGQGRLEYHCVSSAPTTAPAAKSPQWSNSKSCVPLSSVQTARQVGYTTTAKTPSRPVGLMLPQ